MLVLMSMVVPAGNVPVAVMRTVTPPVARDVLGLAVVSHAMLRLTVAPGEGSR